MIVSEVPRGTFPIVFESGVLRFDDQGTLFVHLTHSADSPHPLSTHPDGEDGTVPGDVAESVIEGREGARTIHGGFREAEELPQGFVLEIRDYELVKLETSGDLTVVLHGVQSPPPWFTAGKVHRFDGPDDGVCIWKDSEPAPKPEVKAPPPRPQRDPPPRTDPRQETGSGGGCGLMFLVGALLPLAAAALQGWV
ncbi:MAG: hypothetical protein QGG40_05550 [Myxococcota bacterium]|nr:hypothetical protein [Myxococcota bacterium]